MQGCWAPERTLALPLSEVGAVFRMHLRMLVSGGKGAKRETR